MIFQRLSSVIPGYKFLALIICLVASPAVQAELFYSYDDGLTGAQPVQGASIEAKTIYLFDNLERNHRTTISCCDWVEGAGSREVLERQSADLKQGEALRVDLSKRVPGGVFNAVLENRGSSEASEFTVIRPSDYQLVQLQDSGPVVATRDGEVIENLRIDTQKGQDCAISVKGFRDVVIRNVHITHKEAGICLRKAENALVQQAKLVSTSAPKTGPHCKPGVSNCNRSKRHRANPNSRINIFINKSDNVTVEHVELEKGASGVVAHNSNNVNVYDVRCFDIRGPYPRGGCVAFVRSHFGSLKNFYSKNILDVSHDLDIINMWSSDYVNVSHGLVDGSYGRNAAGTIADRDSDHVTVSNVDYVRTSGMAVAVASSGPNDTIGSHFVAENIRVADTSCMARDGVPPSSGGLVVWIKGGADYPRVSNYQYMNHCRKYAVHCLSSGCRKKNGGKGGEFDIREEAFELKEPLQLLFAWEQELTDFPSTEEVLEGLK